MNEIKPIVLKKGRHIKIMREQHMAQMRAIGEDTLDVCRKMLRNEYERNKVIEALNANNKMR